MTDLEILKFLQQEIHSVVIAAADETGLPCTTVVDVMLADESGLYFLVSQGNRIYSRLKEIPWISITGILGKSSTALQAVTLKGQVKNLGKSRIDEIFEKNPYMQAIYPEAKSRRVLEVFCVYKGEGEYLEVRDQNLKRENFSFGGEEIHQGGYHINEKRCIGCQGCRSVCPVSCISNTFPRVIDQSRCIRCGNCMKICLRRAVEAAE